MSKKGENIYKRKDGRWEGRYIRCYDSSGKGIFNNREIAIGLWVIVALGLFLCTKAASAFLKTALPILNYTAIYRIRLLMHEEQLNVPC